MAAPALVVHRRDIPWLPVALARDLASRIPDARLAVLPGEFTAPYLGDTGELARVIDEFLDADGEEPCALVPRIPVLGLGRGATSPHGYPNGLTEREAEVLRQIAAGRTNGEIADELSLSVRTVERHIRNLYGKIGARGRADATAHALTRGLASARP